VALMRGAATWIVGGAVALLLVIAIADAIRTREDASGSPGPPPGLHGVIVAAGERCEATGFRLPGMAPEQPPHPLDCGGKVWSQDGILVASCEEGVTTVTSGDGSFRLPDVSGCAPAWRSDGSLSVIRDGGIVIARTHGAPFHFFTRSQLTDALAPVAESPESWAFTRVSWFALTSFVAVLHNAESNEVAIAVFAQGGLETFLPQPAGGIEDLHASPLGNFAFARLDPKREYVMVSRGGEPMVIPRLPGARALTWSPDELYVAIATGDETFIARTGTTRIIWKLPFGGRTLTWLT
jgi:hypothetical protein